MKGRIVAVVLMLLSFSAAGAELDGVYAGAGFVNVKYKETGFSSVNPTAYQFILGKEIGPNFAIEGRLGGGLSDDSITVSDIQVNVDVDNFVGVYAKGILPTKSVSLYGLVGFTDGEITAITDSTTLSTSDSDISLGLGVDFNASNDLVLNAEYAKLFAGSGYDVYGLSFNVKVKF